jgi:uncharacterized phage protein gp47/JayE
MANGLPTPKSREQILSDMLTEYVGLTGINDLNTGSVITQFFDVVARSVARTSGDIFQILRDFSVERATGEALNRIGTEERVARNTAQVASGTVKVTDTSFEKISTKIYSGAPAPNIGTSVIKVSDASNWPTSGRLYIGRGTPNIEGPINYTATAQVGAFWEITLDSPTTKFHNISESVILGQGGTRNIPVNTVVLSPGAGATPAVNYNVSSAALLLDGENVNSNVQVTAQEPGSSGNAPAGAVTQFATPPFSGATIINEVPFTTGADEESDDDYRDRIKKERLSRGLGTALAVKNAVLGAQAPDENARVTSNEIDTTNPEQTILFIDNGEGYEEKTEGVGLEFVVDSAIGGEQNFQLQTGGRQTSIAKAFLESSISAPYDIKGLDKLSVLVGGIISEHIFPEGAFKADGAATAFEVVSSINDNPDLTFEATTSESGTKVIIRAKAEDDEFLQMTSPSSGVDAGPALGFPSNESATVLLYKNRELLNKNGRSAFVVTNNQFSWSTSITDGDTFIVSVDGTDFVTYTFQNEDFLADGQFATVSPQNSLESWANVFNSKVTGVTAEVNGEQLKITSNLGPKNRASIVVDPSSDLVAKGMFTEQLGLESKGNEADFQLSRNTAQIKLNQPLTEGDSLNLGSEFTRAEIQSNPILGGQTTLSDTAYVWFVVDEPNVEAVEVGVTADTFINVLKPGGGIIRYESTSPSAFDNVEVGDYVIVWSPDLSATNRLEGRVNAKTSVTLDLKVTTDEETAAVAEGPIFFTEGFTVIRSEVAPQKVRIDAGVYNINDIAIIINSQLDNATASVDNDELFIFRTNTEANNGSFFVADFNDPAKALNLVKNSFSQSINSQVAFYETGFSDRQFPAFIHGKITTDANADPGDSYILVVNSDEDLGALGVDPSGWLCFNQPYGGPEDVQSTECVEIEKYTGAVISIENSEFYKRSRVDDRFHVLNPYDFGHADSLVTVLDDDPTAKTFEMPLYRTAVTNITLPVNANNFRAFDKEGGNTDFTEFFDADFQFDNYKALMQAKNVIDPLSAVNDDAILYRSVEWGRSGERFGVGYFYPTTPDQTISHIVNVDELVNIKIFLNSGPSRVTTINGTTEWNITISPLSPTVDLVTYAWTGVGNDPGLSGINSGDYVSIITTGEFSVANQGAYRVDSATATSFTIKRATGAAEVQSNVATLETSTVSFFESADTTAQEIIDYANANITDYISASLVQDGTPAIDGSGLITRSTGEDSDFAYEYVRFKDGKNYILSSDIDASIVNPQFVFKSPLELPNYDTNTVNAYSFNNGEEVKLIPQTSLQVTEFLNVLAVTGFTTLGEIKSIERNTNIQLSTNTLGSGGAVQIAGGTAGSANAAIEGSASTLGSQNNEKSVATILTATAGGFHSDQWVKVFASERQKKTTGINALNSIEISGSTPVVGSSKIEIFNKNIGQRFFGRNRYHTRTRGRTFRVEKHGQFTCFSWDGNGTEPYFAKTVELNDIDTKNVSVALDLQTSLADYTVIGGSINFEEVAVGDIVEIVGFSQAGNNGSFKVLGVSEDGKTLRVRNPNAVDTAGNVNEIQSLTFTAVPSVGNFSLNFDGQITADIPFNAVAGDVEAALEALSNITDVNVTGDFATGFQIEFAGVNANTDVSNLVVETNTLDVAINEFEQFDFTGITGADLDDISQVEELDFTAVTANDLDTTNQIETFDFTFQSLTGTIMNATQQFEEFDFSGLIGSDFDISGAKWVQLADDIAYIWYNVTDGLNTQVDPPGGLGLGIQIDVVSGDTDADLAQKTSDAIDLAINGVQQVESWNFTPLTGADFDTLTGKSLQLAGSLAYVWFNVTDGANVQANPGGTGTGIQVDILSADVDEDIASKAEAAIVAASIVGISSVASPTSFLTVVYDAGDITDGSDVDTGATYFKTQNGVDITLASGISGVSYASDVMTIVYDSGDIDDSVDNGTTIGITVTQEGVDAKSFQLAGGYAYVWFNVTDGSNTQSDPGGTGTGIQVDVLVADNDGVLATRTFDAITAALPIVGIDSIADNSGVLTVNYTGGDISDGTDVSSGVGYAVLQDGVNSKSFQLGGNSSYLWFNVTDGSVTQIDSGGIGTGIQVDILAADDAIAIAGKAATAIDTAAGSITGLRSSSNVDEVVTVNYEFGGISNSSDVDSGIVPTEITDGFASKSLQLAESSSYLWFNVTDGDNIQSNPGGTGTAIKVDVLLADTASDVVTKAAAAITAALPVAPIFSSSANGDALQVFYDFTPTTFGSDVSTGAVYTYIQNASNDITVTEEVKGSISGDFSVTTEIQEGDSVIIGSDFSILNQGTYRLIRRFKNSFYIDNQNSIEEEVTMVDNIIPLGTNAFTNFNIEKVDGVNKLSWAGAGDEPSFEDLRPGDVISLGASFAAENQGEFHVVDSGEKLSQITKYTQSRGIDITSGQYGFLNSTDDVTEYAFWYNVDGAGGAPSLPGKVLIEIPVLDTDDANEVAVKKAAILNNTPYDVDFSAVVEGDDVIVTNVLEGPSTAGSNGNIDGEFSVEVLQVGRRNFVDYINAAGIDESGIVGSSDVEIHREAIQFKDYDGTVPGEIFTISDPFLEEGNVGSYIITEVLSDSEIIVAGNLESVDSTLLDFNFNKIYVEESSPYVGYKQVELIATNPSNLNAKNVIFTTSNQFDKINEIAGVSIGAVGKLEIPTEIVRGVDSYKFNTGLIGEANRIVYGEPRDNTTYPGVAAAGAEIFIKAPLVRRVEVSIDVRVKTGVPFSTIVTEVRNSIAALINSNPVGQPIAISNIISNVDAIVGVQAVAISSPQYDPQNDVIRINAGEKALVLDIIADILVSKID